MTQLNGIDCATKLNSSSASDLKSAGIQFVGRYLGDSWKTVDKTEAAAIMNAGLKIISIWETNPTSANYFSKSSGITDGEQASVFANLIGQPAGSAIYFTVDYDAQPADMTAILDYFTGVRQGLDKNFKVGAYGSYSVVQALHAAGSADFYWQTDSWSRGNVANFIQIHQYQYNVILAGVQVDYDQFLNDAGSWGNGVSQQPSNGGSPSTPTPQSNPVPNTYIVQTGDTLSQIAAKYGTSVNTLVQLNGIKDPNLIYPGQVLKLTGGTSGTISPSPPLTYTIQPGDTLSQLAVKFGTTVTVLVQLNGIKDPNLIYAGQILKLPGSSTGQSTSGHVYYDIKSGDTLSQIALTFGTSISQLQAWNNIKNPNFIMAGQRIRVK